MMAFAQTTMGWGVIYPNGSENAWSTNSTASPLWFAIAGTGGYNSRESLQALSRTGSMQAIESPQPHFEEQNLSAQVRIVREVLRLSVSEFAEMLDVSRPTVYSWEKGGPSNEKTARRVRALLRALEPNLGVLEKYSERLGRRAIEGSASFIDLIKSGREAEEAIELLTDVLHREDVQRERLSKRLLERGGLLSAEYDDMCN